MSDGKRLDWLDSVRGIAVLTVVVFHLWERAKINYSQMSFSKMYNSIDFVLNDIFNFGKIGVVIFFAVSGFVIPFSLLRYKSHNVKRFFISRLFRLYPLYWISIILVYTLVGIHPSIYEVLANLSMFQKFIGVNDMIGVFWTLQIELIFYFLCVVMFLFKLLNSTKHIFYCVYGFTILSLGIAAARYITEEKLPVALTLSLAVMFFGMIWRKYLLKEEKISRKSLYFSLFVFLILMFPISMLGYSKDFGNDEVWYKYYLTYILSIGLFMFLTAIYKINNVLMIYFGKISYSIYLLHPIFGVYLFDRLAITSFGTKVGPIPLIILCILIVIIVSSISYIIIEKPTIILGRKLTSFLVREQLKQINMVG